MGPKTPVVQSSELFCRPLCEMLNGKHPLVKLADVIDWEEIERNFGAHFQTATGRLFFAQIWQQLIAAFFVKPPSIQVA